MDYVGKTVVVTGAAGGLGQELALFYALRGAQIVAMDRSADGLNLLSERLSTHGLDADCIQIDLTERERFKLAIGEIWHKYKGIDIWFNNAGRSVAKMFDQIEDEDFDAIMDLNFTAPRIATKILLESMNLRGAGMIVNVASVAGHVPAPLLSAYTASKHALVGLTRSIQEELRLQKSAVKLVLVSPGFVKTAMITQQGSGRDFPEWLSWMVSEPRVIVEQIDRGIRKGLLEITPDVSGKATKFAHRMLPQTTVRYSKMGLTTGLKDFIRGRVTL